MKKEILTWEDLGKKMEQVWNMSCKPGPEFKRYKHGSIIDEEQSVRWNREQVEFYNNQYQEEVKQLNLLKNKRRDDVEKEIYSKIISEIPGLSQDAASLIWNYAYEKGRAYGWDAIEACLNELIPIFTVALNTCKKGKN